MITRIYIDNYDCFTNLELRPRRVNLVIGANGAGKSTLLRVLANVVSLVSDGRHVSELFPAHTLTAWDTRTVQRVELDLASDEGAYRYVLEVAHEQERERVAIHSERVTFENIVLFGYQEGNVHLYNNRGEHKVEFSYRGRSSFLAQLETRPENSRLTGFLESCRTIWRFKLDPTVMESASAAESETLLANGENFASWYRHLSQERPEDLTQLFDDVRESLTGFQSLKAKGGMGGHKRELVAIFRTGETVYEIPFHGLSDGERALIVLYALVFFAQHEGGIMLLDEPENFVGLSAIQPWLVRLADSLRDRGQLFVASHHPTAIDYLAADHCLMLERNDGGPVRVKESPFDLDEGLRASELIAQGLLDGE